MRLFGGEQVEGLMMRMGVDDALPLEMGLVSRIIEQSQTRVEGANFDARKHLLEYDDVLNSQRATVYAQRDRIMTKDDLSEDVGEMLEAEVQARVPMALADEDGPWKLLAWLEQIQPSMVVNQIFIPSFTYQLLMDDLQGKTDSKEAAQAALLEVAAASLEAEQQHLSNSAADLLVNTELRLESLLDERLEAADTFFEALHYADETDTRGPAELAEELGNLVRLPLKLSASEQKLLRDDPQQAATLVEEQVDFAMREQAVMRLLGAVERRLDTDLGLNPNELAHQEWDAVEAALMQAIAQEYSERRARLIGENGEGQIAQDVRNQLAQANGSINQAHLLNALLAMPRGTEISFDKKTHRRKDQRTTRLTYAYHAASYLDGLSEEAITDKVLKHLQNAQRAMENIWGLSAWQGLASQKVGELSEYTLAALEDAVGANALAGLNGQPLGSLPQEAQQEAVLGLGRRSLSETYRQLLLRVISELWVEYLTQMEALRVSVRLEAYAQRDPLVEYKAQAFRMFQQLFDDMRSSVVNRMFTYRPRSAQQAAEQAAMAEAPPDTPREEVREASGNGRQAPAEQPKKDNSSDGKKRRRRRRG